MAAAAPASSDPQEGQGWADKEVQASITTLGPVKMKKLVFCPFLLFLKQYLILLALFLSTTFDNKKMLTGASERTNMN